MDVKQVQYIETNFYKTDEAKRARISENSSQNQAVICENHQYYWKQNNAISKRYTCYKKNETKCKASLTIDNDSPNSTTRYNTVHNHLPFTNAEVKLYTKQQELKLRVRNYDY